MNEIDKELDPQADQLKSWFLRHKTVAAAMLLLALSATASAVYYYSIQAPADSNFVANGNKSTEWKTYKNDQYGFEFKYPSDARLVSSAGRVQVFSLNNIAGEGTVGFDVAFTSNSAKKSLDEACFKAEAFKDPAIKNLRETVFLNEPALYFEDTAYAQTQGYCLNHNTSTYNIHWDKSDALYPKILPTFKFTN